MKINIKTCRHHVISIPGKVHNILVERTPVLKHSFKDINANIPLLLFVQINYRYIRNHVIFTEAEC